MAEQVAFGVLRHDRANMRADVSTVNSRGSQEFGYCADIMRTLRHNILASREYFGQNRGLPISVRPNPAPIELRPTRPCRGGDVIDARRHRDPFGQWDKGNRSCAEIARVYCPQGEEVSVLVQGELGV